MPKLKSFELIEKTDKTPRRIAFTFAYYKKGVIIVEAFGRSWRWRTVEKLTLDMQKTIKKVVKKNFTWLTKYHKGGWEYEVFE